MDLATESGAEPTRHMFSIPPILRLVKERCVRWFSLRTRLRD